MMKRLPITLLLVLLGQFVFAQSAPPNNLSGSDLRNWYKTNWYDGKHSSIGYDNARRQMYGTIDIKNGKVTCVYTGYQQNGASVTFLDPINAEHTVPQSFFNKSSIPRSDIHHLFPTHKDVNSARGSLPFAELTDAQTNTWYYINGNTYTSNGAAPANANLASKRNTNSSFEPPTAHKGNLARAVFYFYTMYPTIAGNISSVGNINTLYQWHLEDPVDDDERARNAAIETAQGNRNPYIDYPATLALAWGFSSPTPAFAFKTTTGNQTEGSNGTVTYNVEVEISPAPTGTVTVAVQLDAAGTNAQSADYSFTNQTLTFDAANTLRTVSITVNNDNEVESDEMVRLKLANASSGTNIGTNSTHTLTIKDNPPVSPAIQFTQLTGSKQEGSSGDVTYTAEVSVNPAPTSTITVEVQLDATNTTAQNVDYGFTNQTLTFNSGVTSQTVNITVKNDNEAETDEKVALKLLNNSAGTLLGSNTTHTLTIKDNPPVNTPVISFDNLTGSIEEDTDNELTYSTQISISPAPTSTVTVDVQIDNAGTTAQSADYTFSTTTLTFSPSQTTQTLEVKIAADGAGNENDETIRFGLSNLTGTASVGTNSTHTLTIKDAQSVPNPTVQFSKASGTINESSGTELVYQTEIRLSTVPTQNYTVEVSVDPDNTMATLNEDYTFTPLVLTFSPTKTSHIVSINIKPDTKTEGDEQIQLKLSNPSSGLDLGATPTHTLVIKDANPTGLQNAQISGIEVFPNITDTYVNITNGRGLQYSLTVFDIRGRAFIQKQVNSSTYQMSVQSLSAGWYFLQISNGKQVMVRRIAVMR